MGLILFQLKSMCVKQVYNWWMCWWCGEQEAAEKLILKKNFEEFPVDAGMMNESMLSEFLLESIPQLLLQGLNNTATDQWDGGVSLFSFAFSATVVLNSVYRFGYYKLWRGGVTVAEVPNRVVIPNPCGESIKFELGREDAITEAERESNLFRILDVHHLHRVVDKAFMEVSDASNTNISHGRFSEGSNVLSIVIEHNLKSPEHLAASPKAIDLLHDMCPSARYLRHLAKCPDREKWLASYIPGEVEGGAKGQRGAEGKWFSIF